MAWDALQRQNVKRQTTGGGGPPSGPAGGDLSGTYPNPNVAQVNGVVVNPNPATSGNLLIANGADWQSQPMSGDATISSTGVVTVTFPPASSEGFAMTFLLMGG